MGKWIVDRSGERIGDFELLEREDGTHYRAKCVHCGAIRSYSTATILRVIKLGKLQCECQKIKDAVCINCGKRFKTSRNAKFCTNSCRSRYYKAHPSGNAIKGKKNPNRKITKTTKMLVCVYTAEGESVNQISEILKRPKAVIERILKRCKKNGKYDFYINNSPIINAKK